MPPEETTEEQLNQEPDDSFLDEPATETESGESVTPEPQEIETPEEPEVPETEAAEGYEEEESEEFESDEDESEDEALEMPDSEYWRQEAQRQQEMNNQLMQSVLPQQQTQQQQRQQYQILPFMESDEDFENAISSRENFNRALTRVYYSAMEHGARQAALSVNSQVQEAVRASVVIQDYMSKNPEFDNDTARRALNVEVEAIYQQNPNADMSAAMEEAGRRVKALASGKKSGKPPKPGRVQKQPKPKGKNAPAFAGKQSARSPKGGPVDKRTELQKELDDL